MTCRRISGAVWCREWTQPGRTRPDRSGPLTGRTNRFRGHCDPLKALRRNRFKITRSGFSMGLSPMEAGTCIHSISNLGHFPDPFTSTEVRTTRPAPVPVGYGACNAAGTLARATTPGDRGEPSIKLRQLSYQNGQPRGQTIVAIALRATVRSPVQSLQPVGRRPGSGSRWSPPGRRHPILRSRINGAGTMTNRVPVVPAGWLGVEPPCVGS
jgi:hypothetical protein